MMVRYQPPRQPKTTATSNPDEFVLRVSLVDRDARAALLHAAQAMAEMESMATFRDGYRGDDVKVAAGKPGSKEPGNRHAVGALRRAVRMLRRIPPMAEEQATRMDAARERQDKNLPTAADPEQLPAGRPPAQSHTTRGAAREISGMVAKARRLGVVE